MPAGVHVEVDVSGAAIISALNTPGGGVFRWRDEIAREVVAVATALAPVNDPLNAMHRGGVVGTYKAGFDWNRLGSGGHRVRATIFNSADHAVFVEFGRSATLARQRFSWTGWDPPGSIRVVRKTNERVGQHVMRKALIAVMGSAGLGGV